MPDAIRALMVGKPIPVRNYMATRPGSMSWNRLVATSCWQSVSLLPEELEVVAQQLSTLALSSRPTAP